MRMETSSSSRIDSHGTVMRNQGIENPFAFKAFQVFTGFGVGCGIGIGAGSPLNLGSIPMVGQVMFAARGATDAFSGVGRHVNDTLWKVGAKNIKVGVGCGVGFGHGFGAGLAMKPSAVHKLQSRLMEAAAKLLMKFRVTPNLPMDQRSVTVSLQSGLGMTNKHSIENRVMQQASQIQNQTAHVLSGYGDVVKDSSSEKSSSFETAFGTRTEKVISSFLENPILKQHDSNTNELVGRLQSENHMLQMLMTHQKLIEQLMEENKKLYKVLVEDLKVPPNKLKLDKSGEYRSSPFSDCLECQKNQKRSR